MLNRPLDLDAVQAFVRIAELGSFTHAGESMHTTQAAISLKLKRLEARLGNKLVERTPRSVQLTAQGAVFLEHARDLLKSHERALSGLSAVRQRLAVGISDHVAGPDLPALIARMNSQDPQVLIEIHIASSGELLKRYDRRELDAVIVRTDVGRDDGEHLAEEPFCWFAAPTLAYREGDSLPVATMAEPCGVRALAAQLLDEAEIDWTEVFVGGGVPAVASAVVAGIGVAALAPRMVSFGALDVGARFGLPRLPSLPIMLHTRVTDERPKSVLAVLSAAFRSVARS